MKYTELILKVSGRCNLNCDYCYVFNKGDKSYMREPVRMSEELIKPVVMRINEHCQNNNISHFLLFFMEVNLYCSLNPSIKCLLKRLRTSFTKLTCHMDYKPMLHF